MDAILHCLRSSCFEDEEESNHSEETPPRHLVVDRDDTSHLSSTLYQPPSQTGSNDDDADANDDGEFTVDIALEHEYGQILNRDLRGGSMRDNEHQEGDDLIRNDHGDDQGGDRCRNATQPMNSIFRFLQNLGNPLGGRDDVDDRRTNAPSSIEKETSDSEGDHLLSASPLREAKSTILTKDDIPTIALCEVVMPGSQLQKMMSMSLRNQGYAGESEEDECVICMEGFDETNPRMPTLCGCGANKTYFHLPCLYHWIEQSRDCPACRKKLTWQEF